MIAEIISLFPIGTTQQILVPEPNQEWIRIFTDLEQYNSEGMGESMVSWSGTIYNMPFVKYCLTISDTSVDNAGHITAILRSMPETNFKIARSPLNS